MNIHSASQTVKPDKRDEIFRAALEVIAEHGFHAAPMAVIAQQAGVGAGTIYRYFESKEVLINELYRHLEKKIYPLLLEGYSPEKPLRERFIHLGTSLLQYFIENPLDFRYLEQFHNSPYGLIIRRERILGPSGNSDLYRELFEEALQRQAIKALPMAVLYALTFGPLTFVARDHILGFINLDDELMAETVGACWDCLKR